MFSVMTVFIVAVTDASAEEDLSSGKNNSFCRLISAGISTFYPRQSCLQAKSWNGKRNPSDIPVHLCVALDLTLSCAVEIEIARPARPWPWIPEQLRLSLICVRLFFKLVNRIALSVFLSQQVIHKHLALI